MIRADEIERALADEDLCGIESAFCALVAFPGEPGIAGAGTVDHLCRLLERAARALQHDPSPMPAATGQTIAAIVGEPVGATATYAAGATLAADRHYRWRGIFLQHAANGGRM